MGAADLREVVLTRQRELASRHDVLGRAGRDPNRYEDFLLRVFDATNDLMRDLDRMRARSARRRRVVAGVLLTAAVVPGVLAGTGRLPLYGLIVAAGLLAAAVIVWVTAAAAVRAEPEGTAADEPRDPPPASTELAPLRTDPTVAGQDDSEAGA